MLKAATIPHVSYLSVSSSGYDFVKLESYLGSLDVKGSAALVCRRSLTIILRLLISLGTVEAVAPNRSIVESTGCHTALQ